MPSLEVLAAVGRWCGVAQSVSLLLGGHGSLALTFCLLCKHLYLGQLSLKCFNIWILCRCKQLMSLQGSEKSGLRSSGLHGISSTLSSLHCYLNKETCNSDSKISGEFLQTRLNQTVVREIKLKFMLWQQLGEHWWAGEKIKERTMVAQKKREGTQGITPHHTSGYTLISCQSLRTPLPLPSPCCANISLCGSVL